MMFPMIASVNAGQFCSDGSLTLQRARRLPGAASRQAADSKMDVQRGREDPHRRADQRRARFLASRLLWAEMMPCIMRPETAKPWYRNSAMSPFPDFDLMHKRQAISEPAFADDSTLE